MTDIPTGKIFNAFSEKGKMIVFEIHAYGWLQKLLQKLRVKPKTRVIHVTPIKYGVRGLCATYLNKASFDKHANNTVFKAGSLFAEHELDNIIMFLATVVWNRNDSKPPLWLIKCIRSLDQEGVDEIIDFAKESINTEVFLHSIISMIGVSLQPEEIIAPVKENQAPTK